MTAWDTEPMLSENDLNELLAIAALEDVNGLTPLHEEWMPTYDLNACAAQAWIIKAGRASALVEIDPPESGIATSKVFDNCRAMAMIYAAKRMLSVSLR